MENSEPSKADNGQTQNNSTPRSWLSPDGGPKPVSQLDMTFGAAGRLVGDYLPRWDEIPEEFKRGNTHWNKLVSKWFFSGAEASEFTAKEGIDKNAALRQLQTCLEKNLLLSALKVWETKNGIGQSNITMHGVSMAYWPRKRKVALG